ncbi:MAG: hypothetical protein AAF416_18670 [Pseudomonadota bacterium]
MTNTDPGPSPLTPEEARRLHDIERNAFTAEDETLFQMFERAGSPVRLAMCTLGSPCTAATL